MLTNWPQRTLDDTTQVFPMIEEFLQLFRNDKNSCNSLFQDTGFSKGYGFITYYEADDAKMAMEQMNGFEIAGRPIKVSMVVDKQQEGSYPYSGSLELEELDRFVALKLLKYV